MSQKKRTVLIMAGGTGGHVFPALATADVLRKQGVGVQWLGTANRIEANVVPAAGIKLHTISVEGLRGKGKLGLLKAPFKLLVAVMQAFKVLRQVRPDAVLGMGGFASGPGGLAAWLTRTPLVIHEQNAFAGMTNKVLSRFATRVLQAFPGAFGGQNKGDIVGNPVRGKILELPEPASRYEGREGPLRLLIVGGSLGAQAINQLVPKVLAELDESARPEIWHQTGAKNIDGTLKAYEQHHVSGRVVPFIDDMAEAYAWADLVLCRSGALTISELAIAGVASVLVPYPYAVDDHQRVNAEFLVEQGGAQCVLQQELSVEKLLTLLQQLNDRQTLLKMAEAARGLARPEASQTVAGVCVEVMK